MQPKACAGLAIEESTSPQERIQKHMPNHIKDFLYTTNMLQSKRDIRAHH